MILPTALVLVFAAFSEPQAPPPPVPVYVEAEEVQYLAQERQVIFLGDPLVHVRREDATLVCRKLVIQNDGQGQLETADCTGDVRLDRGDQVVTCDTASFRNAANRVICRGKPVVVRDGQSVGRGDELIYDLDDGKAVLVGKPVSGEVHQKPGQSFRPSRKEGGR